MAIGSGKKIGNIGVIRNRREHVLNFWELDS